MEESLGNLTADFKSSLLLASSKQEKKEVGPQRKALLVIKQAASSRPLTAFNSPSLSEAVGAGSTLPKYSGFTDRTSTWLPSNPALFYSVLAISIFMISVMNL